MNESLQKDVIIEQMNKEYEEQTFLERRNCEDRLPDCTQHEIYAR